MNPKWPFFWTMILLSLLSLTGCTDSVKHTKKSKKTTVEQTETDSEPFVEMTPAQKLQSDITGLEASVQKLRAAHEKIKAFLVKRTVESRRFQARFRQELARCDGNTEATLNEFRTAENEKQLSEKSRNNPQIFKTYQTWTQWQGFELDRAMAQKRFDELDKQVVLIQTKLENLRRLKETSETMEVQYDTAEIDRMIASGDVDAEKATDMSDALKASLIEGVQKDMLQESERKSKIDLISLPEKKLTDMVPFPVFQFPGEEDSWSLLQKRLVNELRKIIRSAQNKAKPLLDKQKTQQAYDVWAQAVERLRKPLRAFTVDDAWKQEQLAALDKMQEKIVERQTFPYTQALGKALNQLAESDEYWDEVLGLLESLGEVCPLKELSEKNADFAKTLRDLEELLTSIRNMNEVDALVIQERFDNVQWWKTAERKRLEAEAKAAKDREEAERQKKVAQEVEKIRQEEARSKAAHVEEQQAQEKLKQKKLKEAEELRQAEHEAQLEVLAQKKAEAKRKKAEEKARLAEAHSKRTWTEATKDFFADLPYGIIGIFLVTITGFLSIMCAVAPSTQKGIRKLARLTLKILAAVFVAVMFLLACYVVLLIASSLSPTKGDEVLFIFGVAGICLLVLFIAFCGVIAHIFRHSEPDEETSPDSPLGVTPDATKKPARSEDFFWNILKIVFGIFIVTLLFSHKDSRSKNDPFGPPY